MEMIVWLIFGAAMGVIAATKRGWSPVVGGFAGAILGILSPLLFFVSGVAKGDKSKACPQCAERVKAAAKVCRYCGAKFDTPEVQPEQSSSPPKPAAASKKLPTREYFLQCVDRVTGAESIETFHATDEQSAIDAAGDKGKVVSRVMGVK